MKEIKVKSKDAQLANEVASGLDSLGQFELHELVQLDFRNVACVVRIERDTLFVLDQVRWAFVAAKFARLSARFRRAD